jgi:hypothetical protein
VWGHVTAVTGRRCPRDRTRRPADVKGINMEVCLKVCQSAVLIEITVVLGVYVWIGVCVYG